MSSRVTNAEGTPLAPVLMVTFLVSIGTGVIWNGIAFIAKHDYGYSQTASLWLYAIIGAVYVVGAFMAGRALRRVESVVSPRGVLTWILAMQVILCAVPIVFTRERDPHAISVWVVASGTSVLASFMWPVIESYVSAGRHGHSMRRAIGWWNISWTSAVAIALVAMAPLVGKGLARYSIVGFGAMNLIALFVVLTFPRAPAAHDGDAADAAAAESYPQLLKSARVLLPLSYLLIAAMSPLMPYLLAAIEVRASWETPATAVWMITRVIAIVVMWRLPFWHGRWGTLLLGGSAMTGGFVMIVVAWNLPVMLAGLAIFGAGQAIIYYAALYYAMAVGRAKVDASGVHEGLIGLGYALGPAVGLAGIWIGAEPTGRDGQETVVGGESMIVAIAVGVMALGAIWAVGPYLRRHRGVETSRHQGEAPESEP